MSSVVRGSIVIANCQISMSSSSLIPERDRDIASISRRSTISALRQPLVLGFNEQAQSRVFTSGTVWRYPAALIRGPRSCLRSTIHMCGRGSPAIAAKEPASSSLAASIAAPIDKRRKPRSPILPSRVNGRHCKKQNFAPAELKTAQ